MITTYDDSELPHEYAQAGKYIIHLNGTIQGFSFGFDQMKWQGHDSSKQLIDISQWGNVGLGVKGGQFACCVLSIEHISNYSLLNYIILVKPLSPALNLSYVT